jgi:hypothetical protein
MTQNITMSENINELLSALAKAQGKIQPASKDKSNPFFKSKYADLSSVWDACRDSLSENGLSVIQLPQTKEEGLFLTSILGHSSGQWIKSELLIPLSKNDPQTIGSALTYFRRYSLSALVGVAPEDDDGEKAQAPFRQKTSPIAYGLDNSSKISKNQAESLEIILHQCDSNYRKWVHESLKKQFNIDSIYELPAHMFQRVNESAMKNADSSRNESLLVSAQ